MTQRLRIAYREAALSDLGQIFWYISDVTGLPRTAHGYVRRIESRCQRLADAPHAGRMRSDMLPGLRTIPFERSAIICYTIEDDTVWITNIFRRGRDYEAILRGDPTTEAEE